MDTVKSNRFYLKAVVYKDEESMEDEEQSQVETWIRLNLIDFI